jgi:hypothetical protein
MRNFVFLLVASVIAFSLNGCADAPLSVEENSAANTGLYLPPRDTESHMLY